MTRSEQLAHCDHLESRLSAMRASAEAFINGRYEPDFTMPGSVYWSPPHPYEDEQPDQWGNVFLASVAAAAAITLVAAANTFVRPW